MMEIRLLGPVEVWADGRRLETGPPQQRLVLAALAVDAGRPVLTETLLNRIWGDRPPRQPRAAIHANATLIRRLLRGTGMTLVHHGDGYVLRADPLQVDLHRFRDLVAVAQERTDSERVELLREALDLWRGPALTDVSGEWPVRMRDSWDLDRLDAAVEWARAQLRLNRPAQVVGRVRSISDEHPRAEPLVAVLMQALAATGRATEALECYSATRAHLVDELGVEPGTELRQLQQAVLRGEIQSPLAIRATEEAGPRPAQLPADVRGFTGRDGYLDQLDELLSTGDDEPSSIVVSVVSGTAGVGKTTLAIHWAHRVARKFPDGQLHVNLGGFSPDAALDPAEALLRFLDALEVPAHRIPADLEARAALYRSVLSGRQMLVLLDNARDAGQVRPLLPGSPGCLVLITSRNPLSGLIATGGVLPVALDLLSVDEARQLLAGRLGQRRVAAELREVEKVIDSCSRLPLALAVVAARAATHPRFSLAELAAELADSRERLDALAGDDPNTDMRAVFSWSYQALTPPAARLFRLLGLHPGPDVAVPAAASLCALTTAQVRPLLAELVRTNLLTEHSPGRYAFHDLLRAYASDLAHRLEPEEQRLGATGRAFDHYLHTAHNADRLMYPARDPFPPDAPRPGVNPEHITDHPEALAWFTAEHHVLLAAVSRAGATGFDTACWQLTWYMWTFLFRRGHTHDLVAAGRIALAAAHRLADPTVQSRTHSMLANAYDILGRFDDAVTELQHGLELSIRGGDVSLQAHAHNLLAHVWERQNRPDRALEHAYQSLRLYRAGDHRIGKARALNSVGWYHTLLGEHHKAITFCRRALALHKHVGNREGQAATWDSLGYAHHHLGRHAEAVTCYLQALTLYRDTGNRQEEANTLARLGDTHHSVGDADSAREAWQHASTIFEDLDRPDADQVRAKLARLQSP
ncbi:MAG TPA: BTAD domain-containing putative transcriptional regulator [Candidatus Limnocylindrales bacterium]